MATSNKNDRWKLVAAGMGLVATLLFAAWQLGTFERDSNLSQDPQVAELQRAMQQSEKADIKLLKQKYAQLTPAQQQEFNLRKMLRSLPQQEQKLRDFFAQPEAEQWEQIDREIDVMEAKRQRARVGTEPQQARPVEGSKRDGRADPGRVMSTKQAWTAHASPELRSMMDRRVQMINQRRKQRGLPAL